MDVSISIVSYNTKELLARCITSIYKHTKGIKFEIIVVDNGSTDGSPSVISRLRQDFGGQANLKLIHNEKNLFFTKANNQALKIAKGNYFLILNSDTYFIDNSIKNMVDFMEKNPSVGACEGLEIYEDDTLVPTGSTFSTPLIDFYELSIIGKRFKNNKLIDEYRLKEYDRKGKFEIDVGCDAFLMVRKSILDKIGGYDERFLLYYTENDLCLRIKKLGYKIIHFGSTKIVHTVSASTNALGWGKTDIYYRDLLYFYQKNGYAFWGTILFLILKCEEFLLSTI